MSDRIVKRTACPACGAAKGIRCTTIVNGLHTGWSHDARIYADAGWRNPNDLPAPVPHPAATDPSDGRRAGRG